MPGFNRISVPQLLRRIGTPDCPIVVDLCTSEDFAAAPRLIPGAVRHDHRDLESLAARIADRPSVMVCQKGKKLSQGAAAWLRAGGLRSEALEGGALAWQAHPDTCSLPAAALPRTSLWVTRQRPKIDRIACPWLIRRFIDRSARVLFVAESEVAAVAERFGATAFDTEDAPFTHRGQGCSFDHILEVFELTLPALSRMAEVIRAADLGRPAACPEAAGLLALSVGLSRQFKDDSAQLEAGMALYDALFRWARDGVEEGHASHFGAAA